MALEDLEAVEDGDVDDAAAEFGHRRRNALGSEAVNVVLLKPELNLAELKAFLTLAHPHEWHLARHPTLHGPARYLVMHRQLSLSEKRFANHARRCEVG